MTINLADNNPRIEYSVAQGVTQTTFAIPFEFFDDGDISIYVDGVLKAEGTDYTLSGGDGSTGTLTFVTAVPPAVQQVTGATGGSKVVIFRSTPIERTSDFSTGSDINRAALNEQLDILTAMIADLKDRVDRTIRLNAYEIAPSLTLPSVASRKGKVLAFNETTGAVQEGPTVSALDTVANSAADLQTIADNIAEILDADDQATAAAASASAASSSASAAASSASAASSSASAASGSASAAAGSASTAASLLDSFDDRYLGSKSSDPTLDNDGNALLTGALYYNTTDNVMKVYSGTAWVAAYASLSGTLLASNNLSDLTSASSALINLGLTATAAELNVLDGVTASTAELNILDGVTASTSELNILDGVTASASELNILDGATLSTTELNYVDGVTSAIQTQLNAKQPLDATLTALAAYNSNGFVVQQAGDVFIARSIAGTANQIQVSNGNGVSDNPTISAIIASQAEAEAGTDSTKLMTAQRVSQAINGLQDFNLLGTLTTTSGTTQTLSGLSLTAYSALLVFVDGVSHNGSGGASQSLKLGTANIQNTARGATDLISGPIWAMLGSGSATGLVDRDTSTNASRQNATGYTTATTSISFTWDGGAAFDAGKITVYGVR